MARVRFTADFDYRVSPAFLIAYKAGQERTVKRDCCEKAVAKGKAVEIPLFPRQVTHGKDQVSR